MNNKFNHVIIGVMFLLVFLIIKPSVLLGDEAEELLNKAKECYTKRADKDELKKAEGFCNKALDIVKDEETKAEIYVELSKCFFKLAEYHEKDNKAEVFYNGYECAEKAVKIDPEKAEEYYWKAVNFGYYCKNGSGWKKLKRCSNVGSEFKASLERVIDINPSYDCWGAHRALAAYYINIPWPLKDKEKAVEYIEKAMNEKNGAPDYLWNMFIQAKVYTGVGKEEEAKSILQSILEKDIDQLPNDARAENKHVQKKAEKLLKDMQ
jgi:tetratricopeptide (TPR) repeat protein